MTQPRYTICITDEATEMPRCFSISIQSLVAWRLALRALTLPAIWIAPENSSSFSVSVVLPASGWLMIANVRRRRTSPSMRVELSSGMGGDYPVAHFRPMPELPDVTVYVERTEALLAGQVLRRLRILNP